MAQQNKHTIIELKEAEMMGPKPKPEKISKSSRPRYGFIFATTSSQEIIQNEHFDKQKQNIDLPSTYLDNCQWSQMCEKIWKYHWTHTWNQILPASWTFASCNKSTISRPKLYTEDSIQIINILHTLLDSLPGNIT